MTLLPSDQDLLSSLLGWPSCCSWVSAPWMQSVRGPWVQGTLVRARTISYFPAIPGTATKIVSYFTNWSQYCSGFACYMPENVDPCLCTHIICASAGMTNCQITTSEWNDETLYAGINGLKH